ncbi:MAG: DinB family protein [Ilumatobacteraceae bacterium]
MAEEMIDRRLPSRTAGERDMLRGWLDFHRATFARKLQGLSPAQLALRSAEPSEMSLLGLLQHHAEGERYMFGCVFRAEADVPYFGDVDFGDLTGADDVVVATSWATWHQACERSRAIEAAAALDDMSAAAGPWEDEPVSLRWLMVHVIEEYARHNGHADLLRERIDGNSGW